MKLAYRLVPFIGDTDRDILRRFDGQSDAVLTNAAACQESLERGLEGWVSSPSPYEALPGPEQTCVAAQAAARQAQQLGLAGLAQAFTEPQVAMRRALEASLATTIAPSFSPPSPRPQPRPGLGRSRPAALRYPQG